MTDFYYQDQDADEDAPAGDRRRPSPAVQYPADRAFFARAEEPARGYDDDPPVSSGDAWGEPENAWGETAADGEYLPAEDTDQAGDGAAQGYPSAEDAYYDEEADDQYAYPPPREAGYGAFDLGLAEPPERSPEEAYYADEPEPAGHPMPAGAAAVAGTAAARHIRFDPTKERGDSYFERAERHSRHVRWLKIVLPTVAFLGIAGFLALVQFAPTPETAVVSLSGINVELKSVTMKKPHISGFEGTRRSYEVTADHAVQDLNNPKMMTMTTITARIGTGDGGTAHVQAATGVYDGNTSKLRLSDGITVETSDGYKATLQDADIDVDSGKMTSQKPVEIVTDQLTVKADTIEVQDQGKHVWFRNNVTVVYTPKDEPAGDAATAKPANGGDAATAGPANGSDAAAAKPADGGDTVMAKPADGGDTVAAGPADGGNAAAAKPADGGDTAAAKPAKSAKAAKPAKPTKSAKSAKSGGAAAAATPAGGDGATEATTAGGDPPPAKDASGGSSP